MDVYRIPIENLNAVNYDSTYHILTIIGQGELISYDDYPSRRINYYNSQRRFYGNSSYSILMAFDEEQIVVDIIMGMVKMKKEELSNDN